MDPSDVDVINKFSRPSTEHWFGTDHMGRDIFTRIVYGMKYTLGVGFGSVFWAAIMGIAIRNRCRLLWRAY